ncbi:MAG: ABC transporter ATP-binding protein/permease [Chitinophagales bacterium]|nr:ABC transporter ATP-binding protein/permease [Chitinophagales bacterium]MDW8419735.1 ABC transporter ATP-binding protein [Chitinophagales bacterium]
MSEQKKPVFDWALLNRIVRLATPYRTVFYGSLLLSAVLAALSIARPLLVIYTVDTYIARRPFQAEGLRNMALLMAVLLFAEAALRYGFNYLTAWLGQSIVKDLRTATFNHLIHAKLAYYDRTPIGTSTTRTITDIEAINDIFSEGLISIVADLLTIAAVLGAMFYTNWKVALASVAVLPVLLWVTRWFQRGVKRAFQDERTEIGRMNAFLQERITGMRIIQIFHAEEQERKKFDAINQSLLQANLRSIWYYSLFFPAVEICLAVAIGLMVWMASHEILRGSPSSTQIVTLGDVGIISGFLLMINMLFRPLRIIADKVNIIQRGLVASERVFRLLDSPLRPKDNGRLSPDRLQGHIAFRDVWFSYGRDEWVIKNLSFSINAGETLAIVGPTGSGKTTVISLLGRFYEVQRGNILIDGTDIRHYKMAALRRRMAVVLQDVFLFDGSIHDNITLRNPSITRREVIHAASLIGAHEFIIKLPGGYDYRVMERGATLSVGQRQLISFVRALVHQPDILILDEATSSIDSESEAIIQQATEKLVEGRTSVVIAHRLSTIRHAHKILVLQRGELAEFGTHEELYRANGPYRRLYDMQFARSHYTT